MLLYKVSYVVPGHPTAGGISTQREAPQVGEIISLHGQHYRVVEVVPLMPPQGWVHFLHVTLEPVAPASANGAVQPAG